MQPVESVLFKSAMQMQR